MQSLILHTRIGKDGVLKIETPIGLKDTGLDVVLVLNPTGKEVKSWPPGFFERTFGSIPDFPDRASPGDYETRNPLE